MVLDRGVAHRRFECLDGALGRAHVGIADPQIDHIDALARLFVANLEHPGERVGGNVGEPLRRRKQRFDRRLAGRHSVLDGVAHGRGTGFA